MAEYGWVSESGALGVLWGRRGGGGGRWWEIGAREQRWRRRGEGGDGWESDRGVWSVSVWGGGGEQLDWGAATLPTLSSLSRINDSVRPVPLHVCVDRHAHTLPPPHTHTHTYTHTHTHTHTYTHTHTRSPCLIYIDVLSPRHATFTLNNAEGRDDCFWFSEQEGDIWMGGGKTLLDSKDTRPPSPPPNPPFPVGPLSHFKWSGQMLNQCF